MKKIIIEASCANCWKCSDIKGDVGHVCAKGGLFDKIDISENDVCMYWKPNQSDMQTLLLNEEIRRNEEEKMSELLEWNGGVITFDDDGCLDKQYVCVNGKVVEHGFKGNGGNGSKV